MGLFTQYNPVDRIYICPVQYQQKQLPEGQEAYLFCDSKGNLTTAIVETSVLESAQNAIKQLRYEGKGGAILCIEIAPEQSATFAVQINAEQAEALAQIHQFASEAGIIGDYVEIPNYLKKYPAQIIKLGENMRGELKREYGRIPQSLSIPKTPDLQERYNPLDRIYICPVQYEHEQLREGQVRVLFCDYEGNLTTDIVKTSSSEFVQDSVTQLGQADKAGAVLSMEVAPGQSATFAVEISREQAEALAQITQFAFKTGATGTIPDYLRKYPEQIIKLGESRRKELKKDYEQIARSSSETTL
jgi:hypothetical protein